MNNSDATLFDFEELSVAIQRFIDTPTIEILSMYDKNRSDYPLRVVANHIRYGQDGYPNWTVFGYSRLLRQVSRFKNPQIQQM